MPAKKRKTRLAAQAAPLARVSPGVVPTIDTKVPVYTHAELEAQLSQARSAEEAFEVLYRGAGLIPFADKNALAATGRSFTIRRIGKRPGGGYEGDDDWALAIVDEDGAPAILTFEENPSRDAFLTACVAIVERYGEVPAVCLQRYEKKDQEQHFFAIVPRSRWKAQLSE